MAPPTTPNRTPPCHRRPTGIVDPRVEHEQDADEADLGQRYRPSGWPASSRFAVEGPMAHRLADREQQLCDDGVR
jgi:hypothetical protein